MRDILKKLMLALSFIAVVGLVGCDDDDNGVDGNGGGNNGSSDVELRGEIQTDMTLDSLKVYHVVGFVNVMPGVKLTIPAGTKLIGFKGERSTLQAIRGDGTNLSGQIIANGTQDNPIVFTSGEPVGSRARGDIGGIVLNGSALNNIPGGIRVGEGGAGSGGGDKDDDNSGVLKYVRVEFGGTVIAEGSEINGFSFNSVGSETKVEYCQSHFIADDGFEWWGGTANAKYLVSTGNDDDNFDMDNGWRGKLQFGVCVQDPEIGNRGYESNNDDDGSNNLPITHPHVYNMTLIGGGSDKNKEKDGMVLRANVSGIFKNTIVANFKDYGIRIDGPGSTANFMNRAAAGDSSLELNGIMVWCKGGTDANADSILSKSKVKGWTGDEVLAELADNNVFGADPNFAGFTYPADPFTGTVPNLKPTAAEATSKAATITADGFFDAANYIGAFDPAGSNWMDGWTQWARN